jgi:hypothetical protein
VNQYLQGKFSQTQGRTNFWAAKMEFMMGMYDAERSGETERIRMRGSISVAASVAMLPGGGCAKRLISGPL